MTLMTFDLPDLGEGLADAEIVTWHVKEGDAIETGAPLAAVETAKAVVDAPSPYTGSIAKLYASRNRRITKQDVADDGRALPLETCFVLREGSDVTLVSWGAMMHETLKAANELADAGIDCEVIDVACLKPLDMETIIESVERTARLTIVAEEPRSCGVGAEIAAEVAEKALFSLRAPIERVSGYDTVMPLFRLEYEYLPSVSRIKAAVQRSMEAE